MGIYFAQGFLCGTNVNDCMIAWKICFHRTYRVSLFPVDENGKRIRTNADHGPIKDYDSYVFDIYSKYVPQPVEISTDSVYDRYDILEEIGEFKFTMY